MRCWKVGRAEAAMKQLERAIRKMLTPSLRNWLDSQHVEVIRLPHQFQIPVISAADAALLAGVRPYISSSVRSTS